MQIGGVNSFLSQITSLFQKKTSSDKTYSPPSAEISINSVFEKLSIDKKTEAKKQEAERTLTGFGKDADEFVRRISQASAETYRAALESELKNKIAQMTQKEQASKVAAYQTISAYQNNNQTSTLSLYS